MKRRFAIGIAAALGLAGPAPAQEKVRLNVAVWREYGYLK